MKTVVINLLSIALMLSCSSRCDGKGENENPESSPQRGSGRVQREVPTDPQEIRAIVQRYLRAGSSVPYQEADALRRMDTQAVPYLIEAAIAENGKSQRVYVLLHHALNRLSEDARSQAAPKLLEVFTDENTSVELANGLLTMISGLGKPGLVIESDLITLRRTRPELESDINDALISIQSARSASIYAVRLAKRPNVVLLRDTAELGARAGDAGPEVTKLLGHPDWDIRLAAARTLGFIGHTEAIPALIEALNDPTDVRLNRMAAESLGRLGAQSAVEALREAAANHWHPAVRDKAKDALEHIVSGKPYEAKAGSRDRLLEYLGRSYWGIESSTQKRPELLQEPLELKLYKSSSPARMKELSYESEIVSYGAGDEEEQRAAKARGATVVKERGRVKYQTPIEQVPDVALRMENGWLAGSDRGEWGGELVFVADDGQRPYVLEDNVDDLFMLGEKTIAVTGLSHLGIHYGCVYEIKPTESGQWVAEPWRALPGAPRSCGKLPSGEIFISTSGGGDVILSPDGTFRMASP